MGPPASVAACRTAVRQAVADLVAERAHPTVVVAVSGGPDSTALLDACCFALPRLGVRVAALTVDHGLQEGSGQRTQSRTDLYYVSSGLVDTGLGDTGHRVWTDQEILAPGFLGLQPMSPEHGARIFEQCSGF